VTLLLLMLACGSDPGPAADDPSTGGAADPGGTADGGSDAGAQEAPASSLDAVQLLARASLDLRGVRPSVEEIEAVEADADAYARLVDDFLADDRFGDSVRRAWGEVLLTRQDYYYVTAADFGLSDEVGFVESVGDEPLRIIERVATEDLPWTDVVTADWTMANELLGSFYPVDYPADGQGWLPVSYNDGRPAAGILSTNGMWWRYLTTDSNANRGRANAVSRSLLCSDYLSRPIEFDRNVNLLDGDALQDALVNNPGCVACHSTLDPLASYFYGFYYYQYDSVLELNSYHAEREWDWESGTGVAPGYYGQPGYTLQDLGQQIAGDPRFVECATERTFQSLLQRDAVLEDTDALVDYREAFLDGGLTLRSLYRAVLNGPEYTGTAGDRSVPLKMVSPDQLASQLEALTGFRFTWYGYDVIESDSYGVRTLAGGVDGVYSTSPATEPTATMVLTWERFAEAAADYVVRQDRADPDNARLFTEIDFSEHPDWDRDAMARQIQRLHLLVTSKRVDLDGPEVDANLQLWEQLYAISGDTQQAWIGVLSVLFRDPDFLFY